MLSIRCCSCRLSCSIRNSSSNYLLNNNCKVSTVSKMNLPDQLICDDLSTTGGVTEWIRKVRRHLHAHPELSFKEEETSHTVKQLLEHLGLTPRRVATYGLVADISGEVEAPFIALRADLDALPIEEDTGLPFASKRKGVMHACGHDGHASMLLGAAALLMNDLKRGIKLPLPVRLIFQPAEETGGGAEAMVRDGVLDGVAAIFGGHIDRAYPVGTMVVHDGCVNASCDLLEIKLTGKACHAARPHEGIDAVVMASELVVQLQHIVSRFVDPAEPAVVTIGKLQAGSAYNIVANSATLTGTIRAIKLETRDAIRRQIEKLAQAVSSACGGSAHVAFHDSVPPIVNSSSLYATAQTAATMSLDQLNFHKGKVIPLPRANLGGEDFAVYLQHVPGFFVRYGAGFEGLPFYSAHSSKWDFNEECLIIGSTYLANIAKQAGLLPHLTTAN